MNVRSTARVVLTLEIDVPDVWGGDCTADQLFKQAVDSALGRVRNGNLAGARVIGEPKVTAVHTSRSDQ